MIDWFMNLFIALLLMAVLAFVVVNTYSIYSTIQFQQKMILELEYKCGWYIDDDKEKD
ncbi:MAG TPA: hypothetical protein PK079_24030 [Leptospiraceae bacterium]|nr:hypothetical protein [Leptospiraceae bacterium]HMZ66487.1 hypothetical protein [Leptospiraceae bacterium]HNA10029.1 hypothetical protein [Leptospiraceae bacterium]HNC00252.1 hypothetical protein [Leptospiraceae bacterium]HNC59386.1 hypothetical protein [Leptospiraceae bacterium]